MHDTPVRKMLLDLQNVTDALSDHILMLSLYFKIKFPPQNIKTWKNIIVSLYFISKLSYFNTKSV